MLKSSTIKHGIMSVMILILVILSALLQHNIAWNSTYTFATKNSENMETHEEEANEDSKTNENTQTDDGVKTDDNIEEKKKDYIKWVDFNATESAMSLAYKYDVESHTEEVKLNWIELLAYAAAKGGGNFPKGTNKHIDTLAQKLKNKEDTLENITKDMKYYKYYLESYTAILGGMVGEYEIEVSPEDDTNSKKWEGKYGLKAYLPIAKGFPFSGYDDFGVSRTYGFSRNHLGHDMMGQTGTPIIAVESGYIEALGWNQYGGWRIGIRSFDKKRYYYYAHLRQNFPYNKELKEGSVVQAGDVIGYLGHTGYSTKENTNNIKTPHLHFGLQLIFDESQKESTNEIWIDCYQLTKFLYKNRSEATKNVETKEWYRIYNIKDPSVDEYLKSQETKQRLVQ